MGPLLALWAELQERVGAVALLAIPEAGAEVHGPTSSGRDAAWVARRISRKGAVPVVFGDCEHREAANGTGQRGDSSGEILGPVSMERPGQAS